MSQPFKLYRLQQIDSQLDRGRARLQEIEIALSADEALQQAQANAHLVEEMLQSERKALHQAENSVQDQRIKIEQTEAALYGGKIRNPKELTDLQNEAAALKRYKAVLEDRQLEVMLAVEAAEAALDQANTELELVKTQFERQHSTLVDEQASLSKDVARLEGERQAAAGGIPPEDINLYETLRKQRRGIAVARVSDRACSACGSTLNAALLHAARSPSQINRCDTCGRILYVG
jgi:predicted  nucleic acid-binding Zn-ribbon protein